MHESLTAC